MSTDEERARIAHRVAAAHVTARKSRVKITGRKSKTQPVTAQHPRATVVGTRQPPTKLKAQQ
jgi:hypothetical protein